MAIFSILKKYLVILMIVVENSTAFIDKINFLSRNEKNSDDGLASKQKNSVRE